MQNLIQRFKPQLSRACHSHELILPVCRQLKKLIKKMMQTQATLTAPPTEMPLEGGQEWVQRVLSQPAADYLAVSHCINTSHHNLHSHRVIAFYLPQFHAFEQNDAWWGKGFTEWTNTTKACAQFVGHEQPRLPADLGFYDLSCVNHMAKQAALAKAHDIDAFCVYYYWFAEKPLMETPVQNWLATPDLDFPLCLCWANENWTRRWDGQEQEVLIAQNHSPEDDLAFIAHISAYLLDPRYMRVDGKPLFILYYPSLLPDAKATAMRWRHYMREHHQTELQLLCVQSRDTVDPNSIDFDGAIEFPPVGSHAVPYSHRVDLINSDFTGQIYDYAKTVAHRLAEDIQTSYYRARGVMPGWDNTPRRGAKANLFVGNTPELFAYWLHDAILTMRWQHKAQEQLVFVNAWNEWAEGAYLEPDRRHGHAYICAAAQSIGYWDQSCAQLLQEGIQQHSNAIIIHAYYADVLIQIAQLITASQLKCDIWITVSSADSVSLINQLWSGARIYQTPNLGRDIAPFLAVYPDMLAHHYQAILKIHTKKSLHRQDGNEWRNYLYQQLLPAIQTQTMLEQFILQKGCGILLPDGHAPAIKHFWGSNRNWLNRVQHKLGLAPITGEEVFTAGSMFWFKPEALLILANHPIICGDFYQDLPNHIDGSLAHALERSFSLIAKHHQFDTNIVSDMLEMPHDYTPDNWSAYLGVGG